MFEVMLINLATGQEFTKEFDSYYKFRMFINKCSHSKKVKVKGWLKRC